MTLEVIGQKLKSVREAQGLSLRQIYERTKIPINHLQAIDGGQTDDLPEPVYVAGFIKRYAECVGLDGQVLADEYRHLNEAAKENGNGNGKSKHQAPPVYVTPEYLRHTKIDQSPPTYKLWAFNFIISIVVIVGLLAVCAWYMQGKRMDNQQDTSVLPLRETASRYQLPSGQQSPAGDPSTSTATSTAATTSTATDTPTPSTDPNKLTLAVVRHVWVEVKAISSGADLFNGFLEQGDRRDYSDPNGLRIVVGDAGGVSVEFKGKIESFGAPGKRVERTFTTAANNVASDSSSTASKSTQQSSTTAGQAALGTSTAAVKPKKPVKHTDTTHTARRPRNDDGTRSIPGESGGDGTGTRSIDVPYRYEGRLDAN
jgi:cytoskeletal protein RodZ